MALADSARQQIESLRRSLGLSSDAASDRIWAERIAAGSHTFDDAERAIEAKARGFTPAPASRLEQDFGSYTGASRDAEIVRARDRAAAEDRVRQIYINNLGEGAGVPDNFNRLVDRFMSEPGYGEQIRSHARRDAATQPLPLSPQDIREFAAREAAANYALRDAEINAERDRALANMDFESFLRNLQRQTEQAVSNVRSDASSRNMAFQPATVGRGLRDVRNATAEAQVAGQSERATFLNSIDRQVDEAQRRREAELGAVARDRTAAQANPAGFLRSA